MPSIFENVVLFLDSIGFTQVVLPFILVFTLVFTFLEKTKVLGQENGKPKTKFNVMVSFVIGFFVIAAIDVLNVINIIAQYIALIVVGAIMLAVILGILGVKKKANAVKTVALIIVLLTGIYAFGVFDLLNEQSLSQYVVTPAIAVIVFILVIFYLLRSKTPEAEIRPPEMPSRARAQEAQQRPRERTVRRPAIEEPFGEGPI